MTRRLRRLDSPPVFNDALTALGPKLVSTLGPYRRVFVIVVQLLFVVVSNYFAFWLRFDGRIPDVYYQIWLSTLLLVVVLRALTFIPFHLYEGLWRYASILDLRNIVLGSVAGTGAVAIAQAVAGLPIYPRSIYFVDTLLLITMMGGVRLGRRLQREIRTTEKKGRVLIYGAGDAGEMIVRDMHNNPFYDREPVGFIDDDKNKAGERIHGVSVLGTREKLREVLESTHATEILIAMPNADPPTLRSIVKDLESFKIPIKTLPNLRDILDGKVGVAQIRSLALEDLLPRAPIGLDQSAVRNLVASKSVLITGAGGSIGSELARQVASMSPSRLVLLDRYENGLHEIYVELTAMYPFIRIQSVIADVTDVVRVTEVLKGHRPYIVFHAAAHKHVPLMEENPCEAIKNNVCGTRTLADVSEQFGVRKFVLISTDKAVNPSSVMGASKKIAELMVQSRVESKTEFMAVRFGNVLGSNGSVIPHFLKQIKNGGPVTVTHPDMKRFFMLIPEAVQLVLQTAAIGNPGSIYVLDMGNEFSVLDLARNLIRLCGYIPDDEIKISFIGLRPGEKLTEVLVAEDEDATNSRIDRVSRITSHFPWPDRALVDHHVGLLEECAFQGDTNAVMNGIRNLVANFPAHQADDSDNSYARTAGA